MRARALADASGKQLTKLQKRLQHGRRSELRKLLKIAEGRNHGRQKVMSEAKPLVLVIAAISVVSASRRLY